jgi:hypothetical protein
MIATERRRKDRMSIFGLILPALPGLLLRLSGVFLQFKRQAKRAGKAFEQELLSQGLDKSIASRLAHEYMVNNSIRQYIRWWR